MMAPAVGHSSRRSRSASNDVQLQLLQPSPTSAAHHLLHILSHLRDGNGRTILHSVSTETQRWLGLAHQLLKRAFALNLYHPLWTTANRDVESGYTPLHCAIFNGNLTTLLLLLRGAEPRLLQRPMALLSNSHNDESTAVDAEGLTPIALLGKLSKPYLQACRTSLPTPKVVHTTTTDTKHRCTSFDTTFYVNEDDNDNELAELLHAMASGGLAFEVSDQMNTSLTQKRREHACEVFTFGRTQHCALGVTDASTTAMKTRPCRVAEFALSSCNGDAIMVAAAAYHSLVVTRQGQLYAFGWNKNGRLGTGNDKHVPLPIRITGGGLQKRIVTFVAAAENHSLAVTSDGMVFGWGSNRFGQLGNNKSSITEANRVLPKRVDELKAWIVVAVAAGDKHSVALTRGGQVYTWGDNASGQLGYMLKSGGVHRVEAMWNSQPRKVAIAIAASEQSTLVLCCPSGVGLPLNSVYAWGHGNHVPSKVTFDARTNNRSSMNPRICNINPIAITCAKFHSAAITDDGRVYTWGLHAESLGMPKSKSAHVSQPQLVTGMLPENGGGVAVAVSASEHHTAVVTEEGHLFTWGAHTQQNVLGHEGVRFQQTPKQVPGVYRAVGVASSKEHTILLVGTSFPSIPTGEVTLEYMAARKVAEHVDMFNVIPIWTMAERTQCSLLTKYCREFVKINLDGVLTVGHKSEMDVFLNEQLADAGLYEGRDTSVHPLVYDFVTAGDNHATWLQGCEHALANLPISTHFSYGYKTAIEARSRALSFHDQKERDETVEKHLQNGFQGCSDRCLSLTANLAKLVTNEEIRATYDCLSKEVRGSRKRLVQIAKLQIKEQPTWVERQKLTRKPFLEADLAVLEPALERVNRLMEQRNMHPDKDDSTVGPEMDLNETKKVATLALPLNEVQSLVQFNFVLCGVSCPDKNHLDLHTNGRKHRNRVLQVQGDERKAAAAHMMEEKKKQLFKTGIASDPVTPIKKSSPWGLSSIEPRYKLPPPPLGAGPATAPRVGVTTPMTVCYVPAVVVPADFRSIVDEEAKKKSTPVNAKPIPTSKRQLLLSPGSIPALKNAPWASATTVRVLPSGNPIVSPPTRHISFGEFLPPSTPKPLPVVKLAPTAPWSTSPILRPPVVSETPSPGKSLRQIQQEEEDFQSRNKLGDIKEGKWYVQRTERAGSFSAIQEADARDREMKLMIEEQKQIEEQIARENAMKQRILGKKGGNTPNKGKKKQTGEGTNVAVGKKAINKAQQKRRNQKSDNLSIPLSTT